MRELVWLLCALALGCSAQSSVTEYSESPPATVLHAAAAQAVAQDASAPGVPRLDRKIIYTAELDLVVENFSDVTARVEALVAQHEGYIANSNLQGSSGVRRSGVWSVRVPVARYKAFVDAARSIGEVRRQETKSQDVSEEYYDVEARIRNRKRTEEQLLKLLAERTGKLDDILTVERELSRVREEIERTEGRLRVLQDLSSLTTITLTIEEVKNYVPVEAATFGTRVRRAFDASLASLLVFAEALLILFVAALPWLAVLSVPAVVGGSISSSPIQNRERGATHTLTSLPLKHDCVCFWHSTNASRARLPASSGEG